MRKITWTFPVMFLTHFDYYGERLTRGLKLEVDAYGEYRSQSINAVKNQK